MLSSVMLMKICGQVTLLHLSLVMGQLLLLNVLMLLIALFLQMTFVQKESYEVAIKKKVCENLKEVIDTKYSDFEEPVFQNMKWFDPQTWDQKQQEVAQITSFHEHVK